MKEERTSNNVTLNKKSTRHFRAKQFEPRKSVLTDLLERKNYGSIYSIAVVILMSMIITTIARNYFQKNQFDIGLKLIKSGFSQFHLFWGVWFGMFIYSVCFFYVFKLWAQITSWIDSKILLNIWKQFSLVCVLTYYAMLLYYPIVLMRKWQFGIACGFAVTMEQCRFLMKMHSLLKENFPKILQIHKKKQFFPKLSNYLYFLFVPTLIYRDAYPRSKEKTNWTSVAMYAVEFVFALIFLAQIFNSGFMPEIENFGIKKLTTADVLTITLERTPYGLLMVFVVFYTGLHVWQNAFAEMLGFSDRLFYEDWWTATTFDQYYRKWNVIVHDWLYTYIYKDIYENVIHNKLLALLSVFLVSGFFHEYVYSFACGFCLPLTFVQIFITVLIMELSKLLQGKMATPFLMFSFGFGVTLNVTLFIIEYYARINCQLPNSELSKYDVFVPRFLSC